MSYYLDSDIEEVLKRYYNNIRKVSSGQPTVISIRKGGIKRKLFGIFPLYEYTEVKLNNWTSFKYTSRSRFTGVVDVEKVIYICFDEVGDVCYWKYDI